MEIEIVAYVGKHPFCYLIHAHGLVVEHRSRDGHEDENDVEDKERGHDDEDTLVEILIAGEEEINSHGGNHRIVGGIAEIHQFAENRVREGL